MLRQLDRFSSNRIQTLLWGFSARSSVLLLISNCSVLVLKSKLLTFSKFRTEEFSQFKFSHFGVLCEICEIFHHTNFLAIRYVAVLDRIDYPVAHLGHITEFDVL